MSNQNSTPHSSACHGDFLPLADAIALIRARVSPLVEEETVELSEAGGRILSCPVVAACHVPSEPRAAMDGFALDTEDLEAMRQGGLLVLGSILAGQSPGSPVEPGQCQRIMTGALMPLGANVVVPFEDTVEDEGRVRLVGDRDRYRAGQNVRAPGEDITRGETLFEVGRKLRLADLGVLASLGISTVPIYRKVRVALFTTGDELRPLGVELASGQIYDSNRYTLKGLLARDGCEIVDLGIVPDDLQQTQAVLREAASQADIILSTAGVSVGDADLVKKAVGSLGNVEMWGVALKMGRPLVFGHIGSSWYFGLAGNPVSAMINYLQVVRPVLWHLAGAQEIQPLRYQMELGEPLQLNPYREEYRRACLQVDEDGMQRVYSLSRQGSAQLLSMSRADCLLVVPRGNHRLGRGDRVWIEPLDR